MMLTAMMKVTMRLESRNKENKDHLIVEVCVGRMCSQRRCGLYTQIDVVVP